MTRLWIHECFRVFSDRLVDVHDNEAFIAMLSDRLGALFDQTYHNLCPNKQPPVFGRFIISKHFCNMLCYIPVSSNISLCRWRFEPKRSLRGSKRVPFAKKIHGRSVGRLQHDTGNGRHGFGAFQRCYRAWSDGFFKFIHKSLKLNLEKQDLIKLKLYKILLMQVPSYDDCLDCNLTTSAELVITLCDNVDKRKFLISFVCMFMLYMTTVLMCL